METNKKQRYLVLLVAFSMLLTFLPSFGIENVNAQSTTKNDAKYSEQKCYDGMCFEGEVEGNSLISYDNLIEYLKITTGSKPEIDKYAVKKYRGAEEINKQYQDELSKGGMWLKFTDNKYARDGKPRTFYVAKKPILKSIAWNDIFEAGAIYGWDVIDPNTGKPIKDAEKYKNKFNNKDYKASMVTINGQKYIVRLLQGKTNYSGDVKNTKSYPDNDENANSEWNRVILPLTKGYRFGSSTKNGYYIESVLHEKDGDNYKNQIAQYNWFGDLTLGAYDKFTYNGKEIYNNEKGTGENGQCNWTQEYNGPNSRGYRGYYETTYGAAYSNIDGAGNNDKYYGFRPVLEPLEGTPGEVVNVTQTLNITKTNPKGEPLKGVVFKINNDEYKTDSEGKVSIPIYKCPTGILTLKEEEYTIGGITYKSKNIPINHVQQKCYDGMCFEGEVEGNSFKTYQEITNLYNSKTNQDKKIISFDNYKTSHKEIYDQYQDELSKGGMWLKFTDNKYKDKNNKPRTFYVAKKPILKGISYNDIVKAGMLYGLDIIDEHGNFIHQVDKFITGYKPTIVDINGQKYVIRLLRGRTNYGNPIAKKSNGQDYKWQDALNSEWNRTIVAITKQYRGESSSMEPALKDGNSSTQWVNNNYKNQTAQYNWFGDLTLGAWENFNYRNANDKVSSAIGQGQRSWVQEYSADRRSYRGHYNADYGAAGSGNGGADNGDISYGFRPVLEPLNN